MNLERWPKYESPDGAEPIISVRWKSSNNGNIISKDVAAEEPSLAVIWRASRVSLLKNTSDESNNH
jgi:hypothetical protein